jgi:type VI secretion system Hcp family effector
MRSAMFLLCAMATATTAVGCGSSPQAPENEATATVESPLETTGQVQFYVEVTGQKQGTFAGESVLTKYPTYIPAFRFDMSGTSPTDLATGEASGKNTWTPVTIVKAFGVSDPQFLTALADNETLPTVKMHFVTATGPVTAKGATLTDWQTVTLTNARLTSMDRNTITLDDASQTSTFADEIAFTWQKIQVADAAGNITFQADWQDP